MTTLRSLSLVCAIALSVVVQGAVRAETFNRDVVDKRIVKETTVAASADDAWRAWTDASILTQFFAPRARIDLRIGGAYELEFLTDNPRGLRGSEGCTILSYVPARMLSFSWNAAPKYANVRPLHTWVVVEFEPLDASRTHVRLTHYGFGRGAEWDEVYAHFDRAWGSVLGNLLGHFAGTAKPRG